MNDCPYYDVDCERFDCETCALNEDIDERSIYPTFLDCYNCTDICSDCPITRKE